MLRVNIRCSDPLNLSVNTEVGMWNHLNTYAVFKSICFSMNNILILTRSLLAQFMKKEIFLCSNQINWYD